MTTLGVLVGNRGFFPAELCEQGRKVVLSVLKEEGFEAVALGPKDTKLRLRGNPVGREEVRGAVQGQPGEDRRNPRDAPELRRRAGHRGRHCGSRAWTCPVLVHAFPDEPGGMAIEHRRDSFCGKMSACNTLAQYGIRYSLTSQHTMDPESDAFRGDLRGFRRRLPRRARACARPVSRRSAPGPPRSSPCATARSSWSGRGSPWKASTFPRCSAGRGASRTRTPPSSPSSTRSRGYVRTTRIPRESLARMAKFAVVLDQYVAEHELARHGHPVLDVHGGKLRRRAVHGHEHAEQRPLPSACETDVTRASWACTP